MMSKTSPIQFFRQVKQEVSKVSWATRKEVIVTSVMVLIMGGLAAVFFFATDSFVSFLLRKLIIGLGA